MNIGFVLPDLSMTGGIRVVFEHADRLIKKGHKVFIYYPLVPPVFISKSSKNKTYTIVKGSVHRIKKYFRGENPFPSSKARIVVIPSIHPKYANIPFIVKKFSNLDIIIATSWETAYFVNKLNVNTVKAYFIQHYEIWEIWNNIKYWNKVRFLSKDTKNYGILMSYIEPEEPYLKKYKKIVDKTYIMPLKKITITLWLAELLEKRFKQKVYGIVPNGVNFNIFSCQEPKKWNRPSKIILMPWRGIPWKGDIDGLKALYVVKKKFKNKVKIWIYGKKIPYIGNWVRIFRNPSDEELRRLYCQAHILVVPSWIEGSPLVPMEGMACECAVVATDVGGVRDYSVPDKNIVLVPPMQYRAMAQAIIELLNDWDRAIKIGHEAKKYIRKFTWERSNKIFENILHSISNAYQHT